MRLVLFGLAPLAELLALPTLAGLLRLPST
jgi:hypothetical protein